MSAPRKRRRRPTACVTAGGQGAGRRVRRSGSRQARDVCPQRRRLPDPDHEAFVEWFVAYWRSRDTQPSTTTEEAPSV